jgi:hypothetical protein
MKSQVRLSLYERSIVDSIRKDFGIAPAEARILVVQYIEVIRKLGGYDNCEEHAERLIQAQKNGYSPEAWLERIHTLRSEAIRDRNMTLQVEVAQIR